MGGQSEKELDKFPEALVIPKIVTSDGVVDITRKDLKELLNDEIVVLSWTEWSRWKKYGYPLGKGIYAEPYRWTKVIDIIENERIFYESRESSAPPG